MNARPQILVISSDSDNRRALTAVLQNQGWAPLQAERIDQCRDLFASNNDVSSAIAQAQREDHDLTANMSSAAQPQRANSASS
jgi:hypothetical protein